MISTKKIGSILIILFSIALLFSVAVCADEKQDDNAIEKLKSLSDTEKAAQELVVKGDIAEFTKALDQGVIDVNLTIGGTPLAAIAIINNRLEVFEALIERGVDPNAVGVRGKSLLIIAAENVRPDFVDVLLRQKGVKTFYEDSNKMTAANYVQNYTIDKAKKLKEMFQRPESPETIRYQAERIYNDILEYRANSFIKLDERQLLYYLPYTIRPYFQSSFLGRPVWRWIIAFAFLFLTIIINKLFQKYFNRVINKNPDASDPFSRNSLFVSVVVALRSSLKFLIGWIGVYFVLAIIVPVVLEAASWALDVIITYAVAVFFYNLSDVIETVVIKWMDKTEIRLSNAISSLLSKSIKVIIVIIAVLHIYSVVTGNSITTLVAGLGIGGMAVALAATDTLKNLLGFITIVTDKPFVVGERVEVKGYDGVVEQIGMRTTRIRRLDGHQVSIPNSVTVSDAVRNIARRPYLKKEISVTITYDTPIVKVEKAVSMLKDILHNHQGMRHDYPPRVYFTNMNADNLEIIVTYWYFPADWYPFCEFNEWVNLEIMKRFEAEGIEFAFPTQTLYLAGDPNRALVVSKDEAEA